MRQTCVGVRHFMPLMPLPSRNTHRCVGEVDSNYHAVSLQVKSVLDSVADGEGTNVMDTTSFQASENPTMDIGTAATNMASDHVGCKQEFQGLGYHA